MICWSNLDVCFDALYKRLAKKELALFMIVNNIEKGSYGLALYGDDDLDWEKIANGDWRVILCMTPHEIWSFLMTPIMPYFPEVHGDDSKACVSTGE